MNLIISQTQSSVHPSSSVYQSKTSRMKLKNPRIIFGRNHLSQQEDTFNISSKSVSAKHMSLQFPPQLLMTKKNVFFPSYLSKIGLSLILPKDLLIKIREYYIPEELLIIADLNSRYGLFLEAKWLKISNQKIYASQSQLKADRSVNFIDNDKKIVIQFGNDGLQVEETKQNVQKQELEDYLDQLRKKLNQSLKITIKHRNFVNSQKLTYHTILLKQVCYQANDQKQLYFLLCCPSDLEEKSLIGRNSLCDIQLNKSSISRRQACIFCNKVGQWILEDQNSTNGLWVKFKRITYKLEGFLVGKEDQQQSQENSNIFSMVIEEPQKMNSKPLTLKLGEVKIELKLERQKQGRKQQEGKQKVYPSILSEIQQFLDKQNGDN